MTELHFKGKEFVYNHHLTVPHRPLVFHPDKGIGAPDLDGNLIVQGDNLHALKALLPRYAGKVDCIFIDPPYNTGNEGWCYSDNVNAPMIREWLTTNPVGVEDGLRHEKWCAMMWPRLRLLHELLSDDGSIWITLDDNESQRGRLLLNEIYGEDNFIANFVWQSKDTPGNNSTGVAETHNHLIAFRKSDRFESNLLERSDKQIANYTNPGGDRRGVWLGAPLTRAEFRERDYYGIPNDKGRLVFPPKGSSWRRPREKMEWLAKDGRIWWGVSGDSDFPMEKKFLSETKEGVVSQTWWPYSFAGSTRNAGAQLKCIFQKEKPFDTPKPIELIGRIIDFATSPNSIILDSFAGSGTTAHAVLEANRRDGGNRRFILVEMEDYADRLTAERVRRVITGYPFTGTQRTEMLRETVTWSGLKKAGDLLNRVADLETRHAGDFDRIVKKVKDGVLTVTGETAVQDRAEGLGGSFTYCTLGDPVDSEAILTGANLPPFDDLAALVHQTATNRPIDPALADPATGYLGRVDVGTHLWLIYRPDLDWLKSREAALTLARAKDLAARFPGARHIVFAAADFTSRALLRDHRLAVDFAPLPYALFRMDRG